MSDEDYEYVDWETVKHKPMGKLTDAEWDARPRPEPYDTIRRWDVAATKEQVIFNSLPEDVMRCLEIIQETFPPGNGALGILMFAATQQPNANQRADWVNAMHSALVMHDTAGDFPMYGITDTQARNLFEDLLEPLTQASASAETGVTH